MSKSFPLMRKFLANESFWVAVLVIGLTLAALPVLTYPMGRDQGMYANIARAILHGGLPYIDAWDIKPPAIYYIYAVDIAIFGGGSAALRVVDLLTVPLTLVGIYWLGKRLANRRMAVLAMVMFSVFYFTEQFPSLTQSDTVVTLPMTWAVVCALHAADSPPASRRALLWSIGAGTLCAATLWFKQYYALFVLVLVGYHLWVRLFAQLPTTPLRAKVTAFPWKEALAFALGGLPVGLLPVLYFASNGVLQEMLYVAQGTARYNAQSFTSFQAFVDQMWNYVQFRWLQWGVLIVLALAWFVLKIATIIQHRRSANSDRQPVSNPQHSGLIILWLLAGLGFVLLQGKGFDTHWIPMLPPLVLLSADCAQRVLDWIAGIQTRRAWVVYTLACVALLSILFRGMWFSALPYLAGHESLQDYYANFQANDLKPAESLQMIDWLRERVPAGDTLYIWGFRPEVYYLADLRPATRFLAHFPLVSPGYPPEWQQENVDTLWAALPPYVLVMQADEMPWVTGQHKDSHQLLVQYKQLSDWLAYNYVRDTQIGNFLIWKRKS